MISGKHAIMLVYVTIFLFTEILISTSYSAWGQFTFARNHITDEIFPSLLKKIDSLRWQNIFRFSIHGRNVYINLQWCLLCYVL